MKTFTYRALLSPAMYGEILSYISVVWTPATSNEFNQTDLIDGLLRQLASDGPAGWGANGDGMILYGPGR